MFLFFASQFPSKHQGAQIVHTNAPSPLPQIVPFKLRPIRSYPLSASEALMDMIQRQRQGAISAQHPQPFDPTTQFYEFSSARHEPHVSSIFQLPGTIQNHPVMALPDTGSSQNIIDRSLVQRLSPSVQIWPINGSTDKPLVAPDGEQIPCDGKVCLQWAFKNEQDIYERWFFVVGNCSHGVIIGNGFLEETETMREHQYRLEVNIALAADPRQGNVVSETQQDDCTRQIVLGTINGEKVLASLDTGCEANLMSADFARSLGLKIIHPLMGEKYVKFANGRKGSTIGQVEVKWSFSDALDEDVNVRCHILANCTHQVIFGDRFVLSENPWTKHKNSLMQMPSNTNHAGPVGMKRNYPFWKFWDHKPDPTTEQDYKENKARKDRAMALLPPQSQPQRQLQHPQMPALPPPAVLPSRPSTTAPSQINSNVVASQGTPPTLGLTQPNGPTSHPTSPATSTTIPNPSISQPSAMTSTPATNPQNTQRSPTNTPNASSISLP
ncbi:hypothetical protein OEA41_000841 [Lepraria neglecta]|uniref:Uncharacterized protein n=1 Tax=Lepraria neglecta TaxID=209136 RepID=A0AAE0DPT7_9LECA|nr:hypothetical protein OEA41_000841 [Lepraria neglecta]